MTTTPIKGLLNETLIHPPRTDKEREEAARLIVASLLKSMEVSEAEAIDAFILAGADPRLIAIFEAELKQKIPIPNPEIPLSELPLVDRLEALRR
jgi:hypothetical protein